ncbi:MAG: DUF72 domain-containing protein [Planctomycetota bacterium]|jgi:uncharacterized protein YecE (DUF72 family)
MSKAKFDTRIGTSGWYYNHWSGLFYPTKLPKTKWLQYYAKYFDSVEVNNTFYQLPKQQSVKKWYVQAPKNFIYTVKANRYITHIKRLKDATETLERFFKIVELLKEKLGPVLYQLPPSLQKDLDLLGSFIRLLPRNRIAVFEFRHNSWYAEDTFELLNKFEVGFCVHDMPAKQTPRIITGDIIYIRFHGSTGRYSGNYTKSALKEWVHWLKEQNKKAHRIYIYFNNDFNAFAVENAKQLKEQLLKYKIFSPHT